MEAVKVCPTRLVHKVVWKGACYNSRVSFVLLRCMVGSEELFVVRKSMDFLGSILD